MGVHPLTLPDIFGGNPEAATVFHHPGSGGNFLNRYLLTRRDVVENQDLPSGGLDGLSLAQPRRRDGHQISLVDLNHVHRCSFPFHDARSASPGGPSSL